MKILYICADVGVPVLGRKGASVHVRQMIQAMRRAGHNVVLGARTLQKSPWDKPAELDVPIIHVRPSGETASTISAVKEFNNRLEIDNSLPSDLRRILYNRDLENELARRFDSDPPDVIYERASLYGMAGIALGKRFKRPVVVELNAPLALEQTAYRETLFGQIAEQAEKWMLSSADAVFVVSESLKEHVLRHAANSNVVVVPNGIDPSQFFPSDPDPGLRESLGLRDSTVLGFVGGLRPWHGVEILPDLVERLVVRHPNVKLLMVGDGPLRSTLTAAFEQKKMLDKVVFAGTAAHEEIPALIRQFDIALAPYPVLTHSFYFSPLKLFEYLACGIATVASDVGQISQILSHKENGWLCPPGDLEALVEGCATLLQDPSLRRNLGMAGAKMVQACYTWDRNVRVLEETVRLHSHVD